MGAWRGTRVLGSLSFETTDRFFSLIRRTVPFLPTFGETWLRGNDISCQVTASKWKIGIAFVLLLTYQASSYPDWISTFPAISLTDFGSRQPPASPPLPFFTFHLRAAWAGPRAKYWHYSPKKISQTATSCMILGKWHPGQMSGVP